MAAGLHGKIQILLGWPIRPPKNRNLFGLANQASKNGNFVRIGRKFSLRRPICRRYIIPNKITPRPSRQHYSPRLGFLASCFDCPQNILKFSPQLVEDLELCGIKGERSAILAECGWWCCSQGTKESVGRKQGIRARV